MSILYVLSTLGAVFVFCSFTSDVVLFICHTIYMVKDKIKKSTNATTVGLHELAIITDKILLILSVVLCVLLVWDFFVSKDFVFLSEVLYSVLWLAFVLEFVAKMIVTKNKLAYLRKEFLVIFIIIFPFLRPLRLFPVSRWALVMLAEQLNDRFPIFRRLRLLEILLTSTVLVILSADLFMIFETGPQTKFSNFADAIWFSVVTVATVGYGDIYPQSTPGRILATILIFFGVSIFGLVTASISSYFVEQNIQSGRIREQAEHKGLAVEEGYIESRLSELNAKMERIESRLEKITNQN